MQETLALDQYRRRQRNVKITRGVVWYIVVGSIAAFMLYPVVWLVASSLKAPDEIWTNVASLVPSYPRWENYAEGWAGFGGINFSIFFRNSFIHAGFGTLFTVVSSAIVAYGFARVKFVGSGIWFSIMLLTLMLPTQILLIPQYIIFAQLDWINTFLPLLLPRLGGDVFFIFMIVQFIRGIPIDLDEAAMIDGASKTGIFYRIILPQVVPALVTASIFSFYWTWEDFLGPLVYLQNPGMYTVSVALRAFADTGSVTNWGAVFAMLTWSLVPVILIFVFFQRYLVQGIATTGLKG
jgi:multiple sugar transport system permease protein